MQWCQRLPENKLLQVFKFIKMDFRFLLGIWGTLSVFPMQTTLRVKIGLQNVIKVFFYYSRSYIHFGLINMCRSFKNHFLLNNKDRFFLKIGIILALCKVQQVIIFLLTPLKFCEMFSNLGHICTDTCDGILGVPEKLVQTWHIFLDNLLYGRTFKIFV